MKDMKPISFKEMNGTLTGIGDVIDLPVFRNSEEVISCWKVPFLKRVKILFCGRVWLRVRGKTHAPVSVSADYAFYVRKRGW